MLSWHVLRVKHQCEALVAEALEGLETFWPHRVSRDNRNREYRRPWFEGYLFTRCDWDDPGQRIRILRVPQILSILGINGIPSIVPDNEIESLKILVSSRQPVCSHSFVHLGERVRVISGPLKGVEGLVMRFKGADLLIVQVEMLQRAVSVELEPDTIEAVARRSLHQAA